MASLAWCDFALTVYVLLVMSVLAICMLSHLAGDCWIYPLHRYAVDANVIIFERIQEERRNGKTIRSAVEAGFTRAMTTVIDSNVTTLIAAAALYYLGTGRFVVCCYFGCRHYCKYGERRAIANMCCAKW